MKKKLRPRWYEPRGKIRRGTLTKGKQATIDMKKTVETRSYGHIFTDIGGINKDEEKQTKQDTLYTGRHKEKP